MSWPLAGRSPRPAPAWTTFSFAVGSRDELTEWEKALRDRGNPVPPVSDQPWSSVLVSRDPDNIQPELCTPPTS